MELVFKVAILTMVVAMFLVLYRIIKGPTVVDRVVSINVIGTKVVTILVLFSFLFHDYSFLNAALVYVMDNYVTVIAVAKYEKDGKLF
jgi:multicomponent Na+:H+ antiporter subunit F